MTKRILTVLVALPLSLVFIYLGGSYFALLLTLFAVLAVFEGRTLLLANGIHFSRFAYLFPVIYIGFLLLGRDDLTLQVVVGIVIFFLSRQLVDYPKFNLTSVGGNLLIVLYPTLLLGNLLLLRLRAGFEWTLLPLLAVWLYDALAYIFGINFGKVRMWTTVSPKKSLEGALAGLLGAVLLMVLTRSHLNLGFFAAAALGVILAGAAHMGDLVESALKRYAGIKDSGFLFPGHGGVLDRLDSMIYASTVVYWLWSATI